VQNNPILRIDPTGALDTLPGAYTGERMPANTESTGNFWTDLLNNFGFAGETMIWLGKETVAGIDQTQLDGAIEQSLDGNYSKAALSFIIAGTEKLTKLPIKSLVKSDGKLLSMARNTFKGNSKLSKEANGLIEQLANGNMNPGVGTKSIKGISGVSEARSRGGARVYFRNTDEGVDILGYSNKNNQQQVIDRLKEVYGN